MWQQVILRQKLFLHIITSEVGGTVLISSINTVSMPQPSKPLVRMVIHTIYLIGNHMRLCVIKK